MKSEQNKILNKTIERAKKGNAKALHSLYELYSKAMFNVCMRMTNSREDAEDILQEAFTDAFLSLSSFKNDSTFGAWLKRIVLNRCINNLRKKKIDFVSTEIEAKDDIEDEVDFSEINLKVEQVNKAIMELSVGFRVVCTMYLLEGYDHKEIAEVLNISESTSKSQFLRGKKKIREALLKEHA